MVRDSRDISPQQQGEILAKNDSSHYGNQERSKGRDTCKDPPTCLVTCLPPKFSKPSFKVTTVEALTHKSGRGTSFQTKIPSMSNILATGKISLSS